MVTFSYFVREVFDLDDALQVLVVRHSKLNINYLTRIIYKSIYLLVFILDYS